jgi:hypothetical protein
VQGFQGVEGPQGPTGDKGDKGDKGDNGNDGATGATGICQCNGTFIHVDRETDQLLAAEEAVIFDKNAVSYGDCGFTINTSDIWVWRSGYYHLYFNLYHQEACQFTVFKNGAVVPGSTVGSPTGSSQNANAIILKLSASDFTESTSFPAPGGLAARLQIVNHTSFVPFVTLNGLGGSGSATPQVTATVTLFLLQETPS